MLTSNDDFILDFARKTIFNQFNEVCLMEKLLVKMPNVQNEKSCSCGNSIITTQLVKTYPNIFLNPKCSEDHFEHFSNTHAQNIETVSNELKQKNLDQEYINHMIDHHKSGIDLAKLIINSTKEPKLLVFAQTMIFDQEKELFMIKNLNSCLSYNWRNGK
jgi:uncharacterized protein (DUF305 family)